MQRLEVINETSQVALNFFKRFQQCLSDMDLQIKLTSQIEKLGLNLQSLNSGERALSFQQYYQLLELVAPQVLESGFFLRLGSRYNITDIGILGYASLSAESLRKSWDLTFNGAALLPHPITGKRSISDGRVSVELEWPARSLIDPRALQEEWLAATWNWICQRIPEVSESAELQLYLAYPEPGYRYIYEDIFPGKILFDQPKTELSFPAFWYDLPFPAANPVTSRLCHEQCLLIMAQLDERSNLVNEVRQTLLLSPRQRFLSQEEMAAHFKVPTYTFQRRLKKAGTSYRYIVAEVRMELAKKYLESTAIPLKEISYLLGYDYPPNFFRAFKKWFGFTTESIRGKT